MAATSTAFAAPAASAVASTSVARSMRGAPVAPLRAAAGPSLRVRAPGMAALSASAPRAATALRAARAAAPVVAAANGDKKVVVITGANSGLGLSTARQLAATGDWYVVMACRDWARTEMAARQAGMDPNNFEIMHCDLSALNSVRNFVKTFEASGLPCDVLVANAAIYLPTAKEPVFSADGYEVSVATNHLGHFLLCNLMLPHLESSANEKRMIILGSVTGNTNTVAGNVPPKADLGALQGLKSGFKFPNVMIDGGEFDGAKAYKDSKVCNMLTMREFHDRFAEKTGVKFMSLYPGCIAESGLFRNHVALFRTIFPPFQKYITKGYVSEEEAGARLAKVVSDPAFDESQAYWSWDSTSSGFVNEPSEEVLDSAKGKAVWEISEKLCGMA